VKYEFINNPENISYEKKSENYHTEILEKGVIREILGYTEELVEITDEDSGKIIGDLEDAEHWHPQSENYSCAVVCQEFVAEQLLDQDFSETQMIEYAEKQGWYESTEGTCPSDVGNLLEMLGLEVERSYNMTINDLIQALAEDEKIICGVNNAILAEPLFAELPGISANHAVQVIGIDYTDPNNPQVILNDPGIPNGQGIRHNLDIFMKAWETSGCFAAIAGIKEG